MTEHKYTDEEVIKAIEICQKAKCWGDCEDMSCPAASRQGCRFYLRTDEDYEGVIQDEMLKDTIDIINRQKAEISALTSAVDNSTQEFLKLHDKYQEQKAEVAFWMDAAANAKKEAVKEFTDRMKERMNDLARIDNGGTYLFFVGEEFIDALVKEFTEEKT